MLRRWLPGLLVVSLVGGALLRADDEVYVKGKDKAIKGKVTAESPKEIKVGTKEIIPADDVIDVVYELSTITSNIPYRAATKLEKESLDPANETKRKNLLAEALKKYEEILPTVPAGDKNAKRHVEFKIAMLRVRQAQEDGEAPDKAIARLKDFTKKNPTGWQINTAYQTLGRMQIDTGDFAGAEDTYTKLAKLDALSDEARMDAKMLAIQAKIQGGKYADAKGDVLELQKELPKGSRFHARARVAEAECLVAETKGKDEATKGKLFEQAIDLVKGVIKDSSDKYVKAVGHNTLGYCYLEQGKPKDAMWEFLWVDVVYNQDRLQHAKALFHLWELFRKDGDAPRAQECREALMAPQFAGTEYQKQVQKEAAAP
jgi:tetratricopeptide (TPR) repeat protein